MNRQNLAVGTFTALMFAVPTFATEGVPGMLNVPFGKNTFNFESMPSGAPAMRNLSRLPNGQANAGQQVGDYNNPILRPEAAAVVKRKGELAKAGNAALKQLHPDVDFGALGRRFVDTPSLSHLRQVLREIYADPLGSRTRFLLREPH